MFYYTKVMMNLFSGATGVTQVNQYWDVSLFIELILKLPLSNVEKLPFTLVLGERHAERTLLGVLLQ